MQRERAGKIATSDKDLRRETNGGPKPIADFRHKQAHLNLTGNYPVLQDRMVVDAVQQNRSLRLNSLLSGKNAGNIAN